MSSEKILEVLSEFQKLYSYQMTDFFSVWHQMSMANKTDILVNLYYSNKQEIYSNFLKEFYHEVKAEFDAWMDTYSYDYSDEVFDSYREEYGGGDYEQYVQDRIRWDETPVEELKDIKYELEKKLKK